METVPVLDVFCFLVLEFCTMYKVQNLSGLGGGWRLTPCKVKNFQFSILSRLDLGPTQPPLSLEVKRQGHEDDYSLAMSAEIKKMQICTSTVPYVFMV
jgi:hypothetical protein